MARQDVAHREGGMTIAHHRLDDGAYFAFLDYPHCRHGAVFMEAGLIGGFFLRKQ